MNFTLTPFPGSSPWSCHLSCQTSQVPCFPLGESPDLSLFLFFFFLKKLYFVTLFLKFLATLKAYRSSWARNQTHATVVTVLDP